MRTKRISGNEFGPKGLESGVWAAAADGYANKSNQQIERVNRTKSNCLERRQKRLKMGRRQSTTNKKFRTDAEENGVPQTQICPDKALPDDGQR